MSFIETITPYAKKAGLNLVTQNERVGCLDYILNDGRKQRVYLVASGCDADGYDMIEFSSPALELGTKNQDTSPDISQAKANELLRANAGFAHCAWAIQTVDHRDYLVATTSRILDSLDQNEFTAAARHVAVAADKFEAEFGVDLF